MREETDFERVESYPEYPGLEHPMHILARVLESLGLRRVAADSDGYPGHPRLRRPGAQRRDRAARWRRSRQFIESLMVRKSPAEVELIRESARWCEHAHRLLQEYSLPGSDRGRGEPARRPRGDARDARRARAEVRRPAGIGGRGVGGLPRPDRPPQLLGARGRAQHRVPARRRPRHRDERAGVGLQRRARAGDGDRPADARRCGGSSRTCSPRRRRPSRRFAPA